MKKVLIANRGEVALRVIRTLDAMDIESVAVYSDADAQAPHVYAAGAAHCIGAAAASESYLCIDRIIQAAKDAGADAVHPGFGFLSENPLLVDACDQAGLTFIAR